MAEKIWNTHLWVTIWHHHFHHTNAVEQLALTLLVHVVHAHIGQDDTFTVVESDVHLVPSPV